jgi:hypothetical protein
MLDDDLKENKDAEKTFFLSRLGYALKFTSPTLPISYNILQRDVSNVNHRKKSDIVSYLLEK